MKNFGKILGYNMIIMLLYTVGIHLTSRSEGRGNTSLTILVTMMVPIGMQVLANLIISIVKFAQKDTRSGKSYLLSMFLVLIIGFSVCWGSASLTQN